ncbi:hypothetical protein BCR42DRAFT_410722 [Absidia repens]|uniref:Invertebrate defensins family profile domain-containing protein n=1 Tax=Absidia repens TaxID=90262 RepID=A0A1X2IPE6_9FUNG|nr:hypothetical protein BCR42DRAFT_410722 [Absidia repens]
MKYNSILVLLSLSLISITNTEAIELPSTNPCTVTHELSQQQPGFYDDAVSGHSTMACHEACNGSGNDYDGNGMCVLDRCYCTDVGVGTCEDNNHEGCDAICQNLSLDWIGVCSDGDCHCLY